MKFYESEISRLRKVFYTEKEVIFLKTHYTYFFLFIIKWYRMPVFVEVVQTTGGRTGHKMKDYLTAVIFNRICGYKIIKNNTWEFPIDNHNNHVVMFNILDNNIIAERPVDKLIYIDYKLSNWEGMGYDIYSKIIKQISNTISATPDSNIILRLSGSTRIQLSDIYNWEKKAKMPTGSYNEIKSYLKQRYDGLQEQLPKPQKILHITIHIRKGDVFMRPMHQSVDYFKKIIEQIKNINIKKKITIYSEKWPGYDEKDVNELKTLEDQNTIIEIILDRCLYEYFNDILSSDICVACIGQGSFSDLLINYIGDDKIVLINHELRQAKFCDNKDGSLIFTDKNGSFNLDELKDNKRIAKFFK